MPIFDISGDKLSAVEQRNFALEKDLQRLIERNRELSWSDENCKENHAEICSGYTRSS